MLIIPALHPKCHFVQQSRTEDVIPGNAYKLGLTADPVKPRCGDTRIAFIDKLVVGSERSMNIVLRTKLLIHTYEVVFKRFLVQATRLGIVAYEQRTGIVRRVELQQGCRLS